MDFAQLIGTRIRRRRESIGWSRARLSDEISVDKTTIAAWEAGKYTPRIDRRLALASALGVQLDQLFADGVEEADAPAGTASLVDTIRELPDILLEQTRHARLLRAFRLASPYPTSAYVQTEWRNLVAERILSRQLEVERVEIFYNLRRLKETVSNIFRFDGQPYFVKSFCPGVADVVPALGGYFFDNREILLGGYWTGLPPNDKPSLRLSAEPFGKFFTAYWNEIWGRGVPLNIRGRHDFTDVREIALKLGLAADGWNDFVEEARELAIGDGAPPLI